jgi:hypothetical protein
VRAASTATGRVPGPETATSAAHDLAIASSTVTCGLLFAFLNYFAATRSMGPLTLENSAYFIGRCAGVFVLAAALVFGYCKIRQTKLRTPILLLVTLTLSSLLTLATLALPARPHVTGIDPATVRRYSDLVTAPAEPRPVVRTKWDSAVNSLWKDLNARNQQYVAEISALDETAKPLYTPESFRDAATMQQMVEQLNARLHVADKYTDWRPVFSKMPEYVAAVNVSEDEKHKFLGMFQAALPKTLAACQVISDKEHEWLQASLDLYQFALARQDTFVWQNGNLVFRNRADSNAFGKKFFKARALNTEFLKAYWQVRRAQEVLIAQLGAAEALHQE